MDEIRTTGPTEIVPVEPVGLDLYTDEIIKHILDTKSRLPKDFPLVTDDSRGPFIVICIAMKHFTWRPVEDRLDIALKLESLRQLIEKEGIRCVIEKE